MISFLSSRSAFRMTNTSTSWARIFATAIARSFVNALFQEKKPAPPKSCPVCHETYQPQGKSSEEYVVKPPKDIGDNFWLKKGTFKTIPNSHTICFTCHNADSGIAPEPKNCEDVS